MVLYFLMVGWLNVSLLVGFYFSSVCCVAHSPFFPIGRSTTHTKTWIQMVWCLFVFYIEARGDLYFILVFFIKGLDLGISHLRRSKLASSGHQTTPLGLERKKINHPWAGILLFLGGWLPKKILLFFQTQEITH